MKLSIIGILSFLVNLGVIQSTAWAEQIQATHLVYIANVSGNLDKDMKILTNGIAGPGYLSVTDSTGKTRNFANLSLVTASVPNGASDALLSWCKNLAYQTEASSNTYYPIQLSGNFRIELAGSKVTYDSVKNTAVIVANQTDHFLSCTGALYSPSYHVLPTRTAWITAFSGAKGQVYRDSDEISYRDLKIIRNISVIAQPNSDLYFPDKGYFNNAHANEPLSDCLSLGEEMDYRLGVYGSNGVARSFQVFSPEGGTYAEWAIGPVLVFKNSDNIGCNYRLDRARVF